MGRGDAPGPPKAQAALGLQLKSQNESAGPVSGPIYRALVHVGSAARGADVIAYEGEFWLVTEWLVTPDKKRMRPLRIVALTGIPHNGSPTNPSPQFIISAPLPRALFAPATLPSELRRSYRVVAAPDMEFAHPVTQ